MLFRSPIPNKIVQVVLDDRKNKSLNPNLYPLTEEIEAGDHVIFIGKVLNANKVKDGRRIFQSKQGFITTEGQ